MYATFQFAGKKTIILKKNIYIFFIIQSEQYVYIYFIVYKEYSNLFYNVRCGTEMKYN